MLQLSLAAIEAAERPRRRAERVAAALHFALIACFVLLTIYDVSLVLHVQ